jgi:hypothetical protein
VEAEAVGSAEVLALAGAEAFDGAAAPESWLEHPLTASTQTRAADSRAERGVNTMQAVSQMQHIDGVAAVGCKT